MITRLGLAGGTMSALALIGAGCTTPEQTHTLVLATGPDPRASAEADGFYAELLDSAAEEWKRGHPGYDVEIHALSPAADLQRAQIGVAARSEEPTYDIVSVDNQWIPEFAQLNWILPLDSGISAVDGGDILEPWNAAVTYDDQQWGAPFLADVGLLYYRADLVAPVDMAEALASEEPWRELLELAARTAEEHELPSGFAGQFANYEGLTVNVLEIDRNSGSPQLVHDLDAEQPVLGPWPETCPADPGEHTQASLDENRLYSVDLLTEHIGHERAVPLDALQDTELGSLERFRSGEAAILRHWPYAHHVLNQGETAADAASSEEYPGLEFAGWNPDEPSAEPAFAMTTWPEGGILGGQSFAISSQSRHPQAAAALIELLVDLERQLLLREAGFAPVLSDAYDPPMPPRDYAVELHDALNSAVERPASPHYSRFSQVLSDRVHVRLADRRWVGDLGTQLNAAFCGR